MHHLATVFRPTYSIHAEVHGGFSAVHLSGKLCANCLSQAEPIVNEHNVSLPPFLVNPPNQLHVIDGGYIFFLCTVDFPNVLCRSSI
jgi:hypothetical protein